MIKTDNLLCCVCGKEISEGMCGKAPFPWCNGAVGCDTCEYYEDDNNFVYVSKGKSYCEECVADSEVNNG